MADISQEQLQKEIEKILSKADLATTSAKNVRQQLVKNLGVDLNDKRQLINQLMMDYVDNMEREREEEEEEEDEEKDSSEEEKEKKKPAKRAPPTKAAKKRKESSEEEDDDSANNRGSDEEEKEKKKPAKRAPPTKAAKKRKESSEEEDDDGSNDSGSDEKKKPAPKKKRGSKKNEDSDDWGKKNKKPAKGKKGGGRGKGGGYTRPYKLAPALSELMGAEVMPRHEVVKRVWALIKERQLYDPNNKQFAICDDALFNVFQTKRFRIFGMMKYLKTHFLDD